MTYDHQNKRISTERLVLRLFQKSDAVAVTKLCNNYNIYKNTLYLPYPYTLEDALTWIGHHLDHFNADKSYEFAITDKENGRVYGAIALSNNKKFNNGELAYWIGEEFWGNGYATEAAQAILRFAFDEKKYHKVFARYFHSNLASGRVMQKLGMKKEGIFIDHVKKENQYVDLVYYGIINPQE
ncbi:GNAT family N-acetyltransferase [Heyndrickxia oleronia]|jgi:RimJ/RimL family protein N-acetyltransferase|uniref:GNAT family N-acetyltransferase n=1 Tax=Heyndrickxia oleronia TaxID=38875 RepID=UPI00242C1F74|nr:GNAT family N-acetyltransferase [Heyndrickxia oleronia]MCI1615892.1 GNAT family N-acetyltransferase [Heyndrickxia oleronia]MCI1746489.1 GNAT family N-acetyltransferase [Heyndrickxia oleronia]MCI1764278.1 GNAT family N-acetyltransferase [Heyndrickxia oleronia]